MENLLEVRNLSVDFILDTQLIHAVQDVNLCVKPRETVVVAGESGSGKTVTALALTRITPPNARIVSGQVLLEGQDLLAMEEKKLTSIRGRRIAYVFQEPTAYLNPVYTVGDQICEVLVLHRKLNQQDARRFAGELLQRVKIDDPGRVFFSYPHQLSGGMNQRVFLAMSLACKPELLVADEPTTALDVTIESRMLKLLMELKAEYGFALLFITHNLSIAQKIADRVYVMYRGRVVEEQKTQDLFVQPVHEHTKELLSAFLKIGRL